MAASGESSSDDTPVAPVTPEAEPDVKAKFREALERKNARHGAAEGADGKESSKVHGGAHGPAHQQRTFRRKSGG
jgi:hypothetical protein